MAKCTSVSQTNANLYVVRIFNVYEKRKELFNGNLYQHSLNWKMRIRRISLNSLMIYANLIE